MCCVLCCVVPRLALHPFSRLIDVSLSRWASFLCPVSFYCGTSPKFAGLCTAPPGPRPAPHIAPRTGTPRRLAHLFQAWLSYSPNLIRRYVGKMCPSRVPVLHLTHTLFVLLLTLISPLSYGGRETVFEPFEKSIISLMYDCRVRGANESAEMEMSSARVH